MEDIEDIEKFYERELEKADKGFLEAIKQASNKKEVEENYKENLKQIQGEYIKKYEKYLNIQKKILLKSKKPKKKKEKQEKFKVEKIDFKKIKKREKKKLKKELFRFKIKIKIKKIYRGIIPRPIFIFYLKAKFQLKNFLHHLKRTTLSAFSATKNKALTIKEKIKELLQKIKLKTDKLFSSISKKFSKKQEKGKEKSEEEKLLEKILKK